MGEVVEFNRDKFPHITYMIGDEGPCGIQVEKGNIAVCFWFDGDLDLENCFNIELDQEEMKMVMIMWLCCVDPSIIKFDDE